MVWAVCVCVCVCVPMQLDLCGQKPAAHSCKQLCENLSLSVRVLPMPRDFDRRQKLLSVSCGVQGTTSITGEKALGFT